MTNTAKNIIVPNKPGIFRTVFLYVGQGDSSLLVIPDGSDYRFMLIDSHRENSAGGIDLLKLLKDLLGEDGKPLDYYVNTHPHTDHLGLVKEIHEEIGINQIWDSGHKPGGDHKASYDDFAGVIKNVGADNVFKMKGSREDNKLDDKEIHLGQINFNVLAPAEYVADEIADEKPDARHARIHEHCSVLRFKYGRDERQILITGDADYAAWAKHIADYHKERLSATVLRAAHHGSNSFFWEGSDTSIDPYLEHLKLIDPKYVIVSAPKRKESKHEHPDKEAMELYGKYVPSTQLFHLGDKRICAIVDIDESGDINVYPDEDLVNNYPVDSGEDSSGEREASNSMAPMTVCAKLDNKPMGD
ncbi:MAG: MBL fold metallo-hydrolase [Proteobacteria bacterium]|nr:MBL fold metallo-hydrolase [Pseudomonadota bacterium]